MPTWPTILCIIPLILLLKSYISHLQFRRFSRLHNCSPPYTDNWRLPGNMDRIYALFTARARGLDPLDTIISAPLYSHPTLQRSGLLGETRYETIEPANIKTVLSTKFHDWKIGEERNEAIRPLMGRNVFSSDGAFWAHSRDMLKPQFGKALVNNLVHTEESVRRLIGLMEGGTGEGWTGMLDLMPLLTAFMTDNATDFLFGEGIGALEGMKVKGDKGSDSDLGRFAGGREFMEAFDACSYYCVLRIRLQGLSFLANNKRLKQAVAVIRKVSDYYVEKVVERESKEGGIGKFDLLSNIVAHTKNRTELADQALGVMFAGRDTTVALLAWTMILLGQHKKVFEQLRRIILEKFSGTDGKILDYSQFKECTYLQWVLQESMRLYQLVPLNSRVAVRDTILPVGGSPDGSQPIAVRKGDSLLLNVYATSRRKDIWGEDAQEFKPERWADAQKTAKLRSAFAYVPFGGGPRHCLGQGFALTEAAYTIVRLLLHFDNIELDPNSAAAKGKPVPKKIGLTLTPIEARMRFHIDITRDRALSV